MMSVDVLEPAFLGATENPRYMPEHIPVMLNEAIDFLNPKPGGVYIDATLGLGGHAAEILGRIGTEGRLIGVDRDAQSLEKAKERLLPWEGQCSFAHRNYLQLDSVIKELKINGVDGILMDLGISSFQLEDSSRGFSLQANGPLDMRMNQEEEVTAFDVVNSYSEEKLVAIFQEFGEERYAKRIVRNLIAQRDEQPIETTKQLAEIIIQSAPWQAGKVRIHPATRVFQAIRIAVNKELESLQEALNKSVGLLNPGGRIVVIAFHSLEDRIVKNSFREFANQDKVRLLTKKPLRPSAEEVEFNGRARSARLRAVERI